MGKSLSYEYDLNQSKLLNIKNFFTLFSLSTLNNYMNTLNLVGFIIPKSSEIFKIKLKATIHQFKVNNLQKSFYECLLDEFFHFLKPL